MTFEEAVRTAKAEDGWREVRRREWPDSVVHNVDSGEFYHAFASRMKPPPKDHFEKTDWIVVRSIEDYQFDWRKSS